VGGNQFILTDLDSFTPEQQNYVTGLHSTYIIMSMFFGFWILGVLAIKLLSFEVPPYYNKIIAICIVIFITSAILGWLISGVVVVSLKNSLETMVESKNNIQNDLNEIIENYKTFVPQFSVIEENNIQANNICDLARTNNTNQTYPYIDSLNKILSVKRDYDNIENFMGDMIQYLEDIYGEFDDRIVKWSAWYYVFASLTICATVSLVVLISVTASNPNFNVEMNHAWIKRLVVAIIILNFIMSMVVSQAGTYGLVGSDFCHRDPDIHLNELLSKLNNVQDICSAPDIPSSYLCRIQRCHIGQNMFTKEQELLNRVKTYFSEDVYDFALTTNDTSCKQKVNDTISSFYFPEQLLQISESKFSCGKMKKHYRNFLYKSICSDFAVGFGGIWVSLAFALTSTMMIIAIFLMVDLDSDSYDLLVY
jgi:hypothetical protein